MEVTAIVGFLLGIVAGAFSGLLVIKRNGNKIPQRKRLSNVKVARLGPRTVARPSKPRQVVPEKPRPNPTKTETVPFNAAQVGSSQLARRAIALTCPACGLVAPENLMAEHFNGSPSHKDAPKPHPKLQPVAAVLEPAPSTRLPTDDSSDSVRQLLQMLVPPRAFGRRHGQRMIDPLSSLVQTIGASRKNPVE